MRAELELAGAMAFRAKTESGHEVVIDGPPDLGGENRGPRPMEMVLVALGSCSAVDVVLTVKKMRAALTGLAVSLDGARSGEDPKIYERIALDYRLTSPDLKPAQAVRAIRLSLEKYCSVAAMLRHDVDFTVRIWLNDALVDTVPLAKTGS